MNTTTATPTPEALAIAVIFKDFEIDHTPDGWPAVKQMHLSAAAAELERQHAEIEALKAERARSGLAHRMAVQRCVQAAVAEAIAAEREALLETLGEADVLVVNFMRVAGIDKHAARKCADVVRELVSNHADGDRARGTA